MTFTRDIVANYSCPIDGTSDCRAAFLTWKADAQGLDSVLTVPAHTYNWHSGTDNFPFDGIPSLIVDAAFGTIFTDNGGTGNISWGTTAGVQNATPATQARIQTVNRGSSNVQLVTIADASIFTVGRYIAVTAYDTQAGGGDPPNPFYFEYAKISNINAGTGVITLTYPLAQSYLSTFPHYNDGGPFQPDQGGPATIYAMPANWDAVVEFRNITRNLNNSQQEYAKIRSVTWKNFSVTGNGTIIPTVNQSWTLSGSRSNIPNVTELDKMIETVTIEAGATLTTAQVQSACGPNLLVIDNATVTSLGGTPRNTIIRNSSIIGTLRIGPVLCGRSDSVEVSDSVVSAIQQNPPSSNASDFSVSGAILSISKTAGAVAWGMPGTRLIFAGAYHNEAECSVISCTESGGNTVITTSLTSGLPVVPPGTGLGIAAHPCPRLRFSNVTGCADVVDLSQAGAYDRPYAGYSKRTYTQALVGSAAGVELWGRAVSVKINVTQAYSGTVNPATMNMPQFANYPMVQDGSVVADSYGPIINLRLAGERIITPSVVAGLLSGDSGLTLPTAKWFTGPFTAYIGSDISDAPMSVTVEISTDQGLPPPVTVSNINTSRHYPHHGGH